MSLTANSTGKLLGTAAITYGSGSGVSNRELQGSATITYGGAPTSNTALSLPGTSGNYMNLGATHPAHFDTRSSSLFMEAWVYSLAANGSVNQQIVAVTDNSATTDWNLFIGTDNVVHFGYWAPTYTQVVTGTISFAAWNHVALSWNPTTRAMYVFLNGVASGPMTAGTTGVYSAARELHIGSETTGSVFNGYIRDVRILQGGSVPTSTLTPVASAPFGPGTPTYVASMGTKVLSLYTDYFYPSFLTLPGSSGSYMALGTTHPTNFDTSATNFFVECWVHPRSIPTSTTVQYIILRGTGVYGAEDIGLRILSSGFAEFYSFGAGGTIAIPNSGVALSANKWYHLAGSIVSSTKTVYIFLDGVLKNSASMAGAPRTTAGSNFFIGTPTIQTDWVATNAYIQDVRIVQGGIVPTTSFTPGPAPFAIASPSYAPGGATVLALATQYMQKTPFIDSGTSDVTRIAGANGNFGSNNGPGATAQFTSPYSCTYDPAGNIYVTDNSTIRQIIASTSVVSRLAGTPGSTGSTDATGSSALFNTCQGVTCDAVGNIYVADTGNSTIRKIIASTGVVTTLAGTALSTGSTDGPGSAARFKNPYGIACDASGNIYVADTDNSTIRKIIASTGVVTTLAGTALSTGSTDGTGSAARFNNPRNLACDSFGNIYVSDWLNFTIRKIVASTGVVTTLAGTALAEGSANGIGPAARFSYPNGITCDSFGNIYVADLGNCVIRKIIATTGVVTTSVGVVGAPGTTNGSGSVAKFNGLVGIASDLGRALYAVESSSVDVRKIVYSPFGASYGQPLFSQLSTAATSSAVGAYSLRAINGPTVKVAKVNAKYPTGTFSTYTSIYGIASASSEYPPGGDNPYAWKAFDGLTASPNYWASGANYTQGIARTTGTVTVAGGVNYYGDWLQIQLPVFIIPSGYALTLQQGRINSAGTWYVFGSTDGSTWTLLNTQSGIAYTSFTDLQPSIFQISGATTSYNYYRIVCNIVSYNTSFALAEFAILRTSDFWADRRGNLLTAPVTGQPLGDWLQGVTGLVDTWYDQTGAGNHATQTNLAIQPLIQRATKGPGFMLVFNNAQYLIGFTYSVLNNTNYTVCKVDRRTASVSSGGNGVDNAVLSCGNTLNTNQNMHVTYRSGTSVYYGQYSNDISATITNFATAATEPIRYNLNMASSTSGRRIYVYNDPLGPILANGPTQTALLAAVGGNFYIGYYSNNPTYYTGELYEVLVFRSSLYDLDNTDGQITKIYQNQLSYTGT